MRYSHIGALTVPISPRESILFTQRLLLALPNLPLNNCSSTGINQQHTLYHALTKRPLTVTTHTIEQSMLFQITRSIENAAHDSSLAAWHNLIAFRENFLHI